MSIIRILVFKKQNFTPNFKLISREIIFYVYVINDIQNIKKAKISEIQKAENKILTTFYSVWFSW